MQHYTTKNQKKYKIFSNKSICGRTPFESKLSALYFPAVSIIKMHQYEKGGSVDPPFMRCIFRMRLRCRPPLRIRIRA